MSNAIDKLTIEGFKSIRKLDFDLKPLNVLIGANGAGKSNFISFFRLLRELIGQRLQVAVQATEGGADACLFMGPKVTKQFSAKLCFGNNGYEFSLVPTPDNRFVFAEENVVFNGAITWRHSFSGGHPESTLKNLKDTQPTWGRFYDAISDWNVYHFHDTSLSAGVRRQTAINDDLALRPDASNLAAYLFRLRKTAQESYRQIRDIVRLAAPFFDDFVLRPVSANPEMIQLEWQQRDSGHLFRASQLSDGTLRFICLATALLQPVRPATILFDEPELGLHPYALALLGNLFKQAAKPQQQIIISTQSAILLNEFEPEDVVVVERHQGESTFRRLDAADFSDWLAEYTLGELWQKNVLGGRPGPEGVP